MNNNQRLIILLILVIIFEIFMYLLISEMHKIDPRIIIFDLRLFYSPALYISNTALYTPHIDVYLFIFRGVDMIFPFIYSLFFIQILKRLKHASIIFPVLALVFDLLENSILFFLNYIDNIKIDYYIYLVNIITPLKFLFILITIVIIFYKSFKALRLKHTHVS